MDNAESIVIGNKQVLFVRVRCINRPTKEFFNRDFWIDLDEVTESDREKLSLLSAKHSVSGPEFRDVRHLLHEGHIPKFGPHDIEEWGGFAVVDYFEDNDGNPLDDVGLAQILSGEEFPVLAHNLESVLRLGPTGIKGKEEWTVETANALAHFFQIVEIIGNGDWLKCKLSISMPSSRSWINSFDCPDLVDVYSVLLPIRQLYSEDHAFGHAVNAYLRHSADDRKRWWIEQTRGSFNLYLNSVPCPHSIENFKVEELLNVVMYGAGLVHYAKTKLEIKQHFKDAMANNHRESIMFAFLMCCRQLYGYAAEAYYVLVQDFQHWVTNEGCVQPDLVFLRGLFSSHRLRA